MRRLYLMEDSICCSAMGGAGGTGVRHRLGGREMAEAAETSGAHRYTSPLIVFN